jgi:peptide/nickel transport system substrate-binding protein
MADLDRSLEATRHRSPEPDRPRSLAADLDRTVESLESAGVRLTRREVLRLAAESGLGLAGLALLAGADPRPAAAQAGGTMRIHMATDIQQLDPHLVTAWNDYSPWESMFSSLTALDRDFQPIPDLAQSWTQPDPKTYLFQLRKGVLFHNGREMKAADVKFSYERILGFGGRSKWFTLLLDVDKVDALDDYRVRVSLKQPSAPFLANIAFAMIVAQENVEKIAVEPVGTGPFRFVERVPNSHVLVRRWEKFYVPGQPKVDEIRWVPAPEPAARGAHRKTGTADIITEVPHAMLADLRATPGVALHEPKASSAYAVILLKHAPPLDNKKLRQALAMLVDREALHRAVFFGVGTTEQGCNPFPIGHWAHAPVNCPKYDPEGAKKLLAEAGYPNGIELEWKVMNFPQPIKIAEVCKETFRKGGVNVKLTQLEFATWIQQVYRDKVFQIGQTTFLREADPDGLVVSALYTGGQNNPGGYSTKDMDALLTRGRAELDQAKRKEIYKRIAEIVADDVPWIRIQPNPFIWASSSKVSGFYINNQSRPFVALREMALAR